jgi:Dolichyl-phosphate-mannose-protein mannosyltransferase/F5/8 type C domain
LKARVPWSLAALIGILALAAALRFVGLGWGLRHPPDWDERAFVEGAASMLRNRDLDPRFYEYPGLFFFLLAGPLALLRTVFHVGGPSSYLVARAVVAAFGVASVGLTYRLCAKVAGAPAGLAAALFLAVSPIEVSTAHMVRPDVVLETVCLAALLVFVGLGSGLRRDVAAGALLGAAVSVKPTGVLLLPALAAHRWAAPGSRWRGLVVAGVAACVVFLLTTPAVFIRPVELMDGLTLQFRYHYREATDTPTLMAGLVFYLRTLVHGFGPLGCALGLAGLWTQRRRLGDLRGALAFGLALLLVLSGAQTHWVRLLLPAFGVAAVAIGLGCAGLSRWAPRLAAAAALLGALPPLVESVGYARDARRPGTRDRAADWVLDHVAPEGMTLTSMRQIGFDRRSNVVLVRGVPEQDRLLALAADAIIQPAREPPLVARPVELATFEAVHDPDVEGAAIVISRAPEGARRFFRDVPLAGAVLRSSSGRGDLPALLDGRLDTYWATATAGPGREWIEIQLPTPVCLGRVELRLGRRAPRWGRHARLSTGADDGGWRTLVAAPGRPTVDEQPGVDDGEASQVFLVEPVVTRRLRIEASSAPGKRWGFAELRLSEVETRSARDR